MQVSELNQLLNAHPNASLRFILPSGDPIPAHFHVTEVGRVEKSFIDCGGTHRVTTACLLQIWTAQDIEHRLNGGKLATIMGMAEPILRSSEISVEVEYGAEVASTYTIDHSLSVFGTLEFFLTGRKTDCLAKDKCGVNVNVQGSGCC